MGFYRYLLAIGVVAFHVGGGNWVIGRAAVFAFYFASGFLICRVLDTSYRGGIARLVAFYCNRALRLFPLCLVVAALTIVVFKLRGSTSFLVDGTTIVVLPNNFIGSPPDWLDLLPLPTFISAAPIPMITGPGPDAIPQVWSIGVEIAFYLIAPLLVLVARRSIWPLVVLALLATGLFLAASLTASDFRYIDNYVYKNGYTSAFMFIWGAATYVLMRTIRSAFPSP